MVYCRKAALGRSSFACLAIGVVGVVGVTGVLLGACSFDDSSAPPTEPNPTLDGSPYDGASLPDAGATPDATLADSGATDAAADVVVPEDGGLPVDAGADVLVFADVAVPETSLAEEAGIDATTPVDAAAEAGHVYTDIGALSFSGVDAGTWVHLPAAGGGASTTAYSVELWFK